MKNTRVFLVSHQLKDFFDEIIEWENKSEVNLETLDSNSPTTLP